MITTVGRKPRMLSGVLLTVILVTFLAAGCEPAKVTLYKRDGVTIAIPNEYANQLLVDPLEPDVAGEETILISVYQKSAHERQPGTGFLFSLARYTEAQYEQFLCSDGSGRSFFAKDDAHYYGFFFPTDVQALDDYEAYENLFLSVGEFVRSDFIQRNRLTAYSDDEFFGRTYTYEGEHVFFKYYPYYAANGSKDEVWTLYLSQPVKQGEGGIWCVERWRDRYGNVHPYFPDEDGVPSREYYAALQEEVDAARQDPLFERELSLLNPEQAAIKFVERAFGHTPANPDSYDRAENSGIPAELFGESTGDIHDYMPALMAGEVVSPYHLLPCLERFNRSTWDDLTAAYESEWWDPFWNALRDAAVSDMRADPSDQIMRDYYLGKVFLAADGAYTEMISDLVLRQWRHDSRLYNVAMKRFPVDETGALRSHLSYLVSHRGGAFSLGVPGSDPELSLSLNAYPIEFPFGVDLAEESRESFEAESYGQVTIIESDGLQLKYLHSSDGVYYVYCIRTVNEGYSNAGVAIGDPEEKLWDHWLPEQLRKMDEISYEDEEWFGDGYDCGYVHVPKDSTKSIMYLIKDGRVTGIGLLDGLDGPMYQGF